MMNIDNLVDDILAKHYDPSSNEDRELYVYIKNIFENYHVKYIADTLYQTAINPNFKYWIDKSSSDSDNYKLVWIPKYEKFSGVFEIQKNTISKKLETITDVWHRSQFNDIKNKTTPLEWMAACFSRSNIGYCNSFSGKLSDLFYGYIKPSEDRKMFNITVIVALDASMKLFADDEYVKIAI